LNKPIGSGKSGPVTQQLMPNYHELVAKVDLTSERIA